MGSLHMPPDPPWQDITSHSFLFSTDKALSRAHHTKLISLWNKLQEDDTELTQAILAIFDKTNEMAKEANKLHMFHILKELTATVPFIPPFCPTPVPTLPPTLPRYQFAATSLALHEKVGPGQWP
eukprot:65648-Ditylum_brightwellii.AAC.1